MAKHNVDLDKLSVSQLEELMVDARAAAVARAEDKRLESLKKLKDSGELKQMKEEFKACKAAAKELSKGNTFQLVIPINFTLESDLNLDEIQYDPDYIFEQSLSGSISKDSNLTAAQLKILRPVVEEYVDGACSDIFGIVPQDIADKFTAIKKRFVALHKQASKQGLSFEDL